MLNEFLYNALVRAFGTVEIENEDVSADIEIDRTSRYSTAWRMADNGEHGEQYRVNCPFCKGRDGQPDSNHHLYISYLSYARPVVNGVELMQGPLFAHCFRRNCMEDKDNRIALEHLIGMGMSCIGDGMATGAPVDMDKGFTAEELYKTSNELTLDGVRTWVPGFQWCEDGMDSDIADYLAGRGLDMETLVKFHVGWGPVETPKTGKKLNGGVPWVVIPIVMNGKLKGVQARCPDKFVTEDGLRYWIHPGMRKKTVLYNLDSARGLGLAVLCEGVFDVFKIGAPGVCMFGHTPSVAQKRLVTTSGDCLIWLPDTDAHEDFDTVAEAVEQAKAWSDAGIFRLGAHVVRLPAKDAGDMARQDVWIEILRQVPPHVQDFIMERIIDRL